MHLDCRPAEITVSGIAKHSEQREGGWALLGLLLALSVMSIMLLSIAPSVKFQVQRDKEVEMIYRGQQMAEAIARYYNNGRLGPVTAMLRTPPVYGYLTELKKLREGVTIGVNEFKLVRPSATIDPMVSEEWEPVRARDPRILAVLQGYSAETLVAVPPEYFLIAAPPQKLHTATDTDTDAEPGTAAPTPTPTPPQQAGQQQSGQQTTPTGVIAPGPPRRETATDEDEGDDDDDDTGGTPGRDPLGHFFDSGQGGDQPGKTNIPIVGVAPKAKGKSVRSLYGLNSYEQWVFIYIPPANLIQQQQNRPNDSSGRRRVSQ